MAGLPLGDEGLELGAFELEALVGDDARPVMRIGFVGLLQHDFGIEHPEGESRYFSAEEKVRLPKRHLVEGRPISAICDEPEIHPTFFYQWQKTFFENGQSDGPAIVYL